METSGSYQPSGIIDADPTTATVSAAEQKKIEKAEKALKKKRDKWKVFVDFLLRHISIVTTKYVAWEKNDFELFKEALEKAQRLDDKESNLAANTYKKLKERSEILATKRYFGECNRIRKFIDLVARLRGLNLIAKDFYKSIKKGKVEPLENISNHLLYWKGFVGKTFDIGTLNPKGVDANHPGMKYVMWLCLLRTVLNLGQKFLQCASELTEVPLVSVSVFVSFNLTEEQATVCSRLEEVLATHVTRGKKIKAKEIDMSKDPISWLKHVGELESCESPNKLELGLLPGETDYLTFELPPNPPQPTMKKRPANKIKKDRWASSFRSEISSKKAKK